MVVSETGPVSPSPPVSAAYAPPEPVSVSPTDGTPGNPAVSAVPRVAVQASRSLYSYLAEGADVLGKAAIPLGLGVLLVIAIYKSDPSRFRTDNFLEFREGSFARRAAMLAALFLFAWTAALPAFWLSDIWKVPERRPIWAALLVLLIVIVLVGIGGATWLYFETQIQLLNATASAISSRVTP